jgi:chromatin remodeling complex protein RSC6
MAPVKKNNDTKPVDVKEVVAQVVPAAVPVTPVPATPVEPKKPAPSRAKVVKPATEAVVVPPVAVTSKPDEPTVAQVATDTSDDKELSATTENVVKVLTDKISSLTTLNKEIVIALKQVVKSYDKLQKVVDKIQKKRENARKSPSGFAKPNKISDELCDFIAVPHGTEKSRTDITRYINNYVKEHNLNKPTNRRIILPDDKLRAILNVKNDEEVTFFILQRLISHHFPPKTVK